MACKSIAYLPNIYPLTADQEARALKTRPLFLSCQIKSFTADSGMKKPFEENGNSASFLEFRRLLGALDCRSEIFGAPDRIRTCDLCLRRAALYPAELRVRMTLPRTMPGSQKDLIPD